MIPERPTAELWRLLRGRERPGLYDDSRGAFCGRNERKENRARVSFCGGKKGEILSAKS